MNIGEITMDLSPKHSFGWAIETMKQGKKVARDGWNDKGVFLILIDPYLNDQYHIRELPDIVGTLASYIGMKTADNKLAPWFAPQTDMLAEDWQVVE